MARGMPSDARTYCTSARVIVALVVFAVTAVGSDCVNAVPDVPPLIAALDNASWRFRAARSVLPNAEVVQDETLEVEDWREYAYEVGALRVYVSRDGGNVIAILADTSDPSHADFRQLGDTGQYTVHVAEPYVVVIPAHPISEPLFDRLKAKTWSATELKSLLGPPTYRHHSHGIGFMFLEYVPQGLSFVDDPAERPMYEWYYLWDWQVPDDPEIVAKPRGTALSYESYGGHVRDAAADFAKHLCSDRRDIATALASGTSSPGGRFVVAPVNVGGTFNTQQTIIRERAKPERRYYAEFFTYQKNYRWLNERTVLYEVLQPSGDVEFYTLDAITGAKAKVAEVPHTAPESVTGFGVAGRTQFWYTTSDGIKHAVIVTRPRMHKHSRP